MKPVMDCIFSELKDVEDTSLIPYVSESIHKQEIRSLYDSFCESELSFGKEGRDRYESDTYLDTECEEFDDPFTHRNTIQQKAIIPYIENNPDIENQEHIQKTIDVKEVVEFCDNNGFGLSNVNAKQQGYLGSYYLLSDAKCRISTNENDHKYLPFQIQKITVRIL